MIKAEIITDSKNMLGQRLTTYVLTFPRIILAELNTHRVLSRNSASSRAIPFEKMLKMVKDNPFIPIKWMKDHKGMQGIEYFNEQESIERKNQWLDARWRSMESAEKLAEMGVTKQICNRILEPYMWHTAIVTATEWENFFALRAHEAAEIHLQDLAYKMLEEYNKSIPKELKEGEWHIPFGDKFDEEKLKACHKYGTPEEGGTRNLDHFTSGRDTLAIKIATARCARVSYNNFEGNDDYAADIKLHDRLASSGHWSPFEHCARVMKKSENGGESFGAMSGNFRGFIQYRKTFQQENKLDNRVKK